jgi:hypothetical protein
MISPALVAAVLKFLRCTNLEDISIVNDSKAEARFFLKVLQVMESQGQHDLTT